MILWALSKKSTPFTKQLRFKLALKYVYDAECSGKIYKQSPKVLFKILCYFTQVFFPQGDHLRSLFPTFYNLFQHKHIN